jgi:hypothetical protein
MTKPATPDADHWITRLGTVPAGNQTWHRVTCACGWSRRYVSRYRAQVMHQRHATEPGYHIPRATT